MSDIMFIVSLIAVPVIGLVLFMYIYRSLLNRTIERQIEQGRKETIQRHKNAKTVEQVIISVRAQDDDDLDFQDALQRLLWESPKRGDFIVLETNVPINGAEFLQLTYTKQQYELELCMSNPQGDLSYYRYVSKDKAEIKEIFYQFYFQHQLPEISHWQPFNL